MNKFENLKVWKESLHLIQSIYKLCDTLPNCEKHNLHDQIRRSAVSIALNIAEGSASENDREFKRFVIISKKSATEVIATLKIINFLYKIDVQAVEVKTVTILKMLNGLIHFLNRNFSK